MARRTHRVRHEPPKVWHNPEVIGDRRAKKPSGAPQASKPQGARDRDIATQAEAAEAERRAKDAMPRSGRIVAPQSNARDERDLERERLLGKLGVAEGRTAITRAANDLFKAGFELPDNDQHVHLQLLEHSDESHVRAAIGRLTHLLEKEPPKRFAVLDSRLRRLEEFADEAETRDAATTLRRRTKAPRTAASA